MIGALLALAFVMANAAHAQLAPSIAGREVADIIDREKPDAQRLAKRREAADAAPSTMADDRTLMTFYYDRAQVRANLGRQQDAVEDTERALEHLKAFRSQAPSLPPAEARDLRFREFAIRQFQVSLYTVQGLRQPRRVVELASELERTPNLPIDIINIQRLLMSNYFMLGDAPRAEETFARMEATIASIRHKPDFEETSEWAFEFARTFYFYRHGDYRRAEQAASRALELLARVREKRADQRLRTSDVSFDNRLDFVLLRSADSKLAQGRVAEGEAEMKMVLLSTLRRLGKVHPLTAAALRQFAAIQSLKGQEEDAERLAKIALDIYRELGAEPSEYNTIHTMADLAAIYSRQSRWPETARTFVALEQAIAHWPEGERAEFLLAPAHIEALYRTGERSSGLVLARRLIERERERVGERHRDFALAHGLLGVGLAMDRRDGEALKEFAIALPILRETARQSISPFVVETTQDRLARRIGEAFLALLGRIWTPIQRASLTDDGFQVADMIRNRAVQTAVAASSARMTLRDPALAGLARQEQDQRQQLNVSFKALGDLLSLPADQRSEKAVADMKQAIESQRGEYVVTAQRIAREFPDYAALIDPRSPTTGEVRDVLQPQEAFLSIYVGEERSFVWAVPKSGEVVFAEVALTATEVAAKVAHLRAAFEAEIASLDDIPPFDLAAAHELYEIFLKPVEAAWQPARSLVISTNGALATLPLSLLTTATAVVKPSSGIRFSEYRDVPWLARTHAVTMVPSAASFVTLRRLPAGRPDRKPLIAFGDPLFNASQESDAVVAPSTDRMAARGISLKRRAAPTTNDPKGTTTLAMLPRLPDTADELRSVATVLHADADRTLHLGRAANEQNVETAALANYRVVAFATHGLVPGELEGLAQPALALSAPDLAGVPGDGLLTMDKVLGLKLDADWVLLSACNTATAAGAGAEAASGLGRAFFYAGTRAVLVTNWSVHSQSAAALVARIFREAAAANNVSRAEALRRAELHLLDHGAALDDTGAPIFTYAHPLFWAPYTLIGDGD